MEDAVPAVWRVHLELLLRYWAVLKAGEPQQGREGRQQHRHSRAVKDGTGSCDLQAARD